MHELRCVETAFAARYPMTKNDKNKKETIDWFTGPENLLRHKGDIYDTIELINYQFRNEEGRLLEIKDQFFDQKNCDRCGGSLEIRTMSCFTEETICSDCSEKEDTIKNNMRQKGLYPDDYEGCGYIPQ